MRLLLLLLFSGYSLMVAGQKIYHCVYKETVSFPMPDSLLQSLKKQIEEKGFSSTVADQLLQQTKATEISAGYVRIVEARIDSTFILATNKTDDEEEGGVKMNMRDAKYLYIKNQVYMFDTLSKEFVADTRYGAARSFKANDNIKQIAGHSCLCYRSTDSTLTIWVAEDLPGYINPGLSIGKIKGALLGYELKQIDFNTTIRSEIAKIE